MRNGGLSVCDRGEIDDSFNGDYDINAGGMPVKRYKGLRGRLVAFSVAIVLLVSSLAPTLFAVPVGASIDVAGLTTSRLVFQEKTPERIAFHTTQDRVAIINPDGSDKIVLCTGGDPAFSPDGTKIVFVDGYSIYTINTDASDRTKIYTGKYFGAFPHSPAWSPDGTRIAFDYTSGSLDHLIYVMNTDGSDLTSLTYGYNPAWSPDGTRIAFNDHWETIYLMNANGSNVVSLTAGEVPAWSPNGRTIAFVDQEYLCTINIDGSDRTQLTTSHAWYRTHRPTWSPDGTKIAYADGDQKSYIYVINADGTDRTMLCEGGDPTWTPFRDYAAPSRRPTAYIDSILPNPASQGQAISFSGHGTDPDSGDYITAYDWRSSLDGQLSTSNSFSKLDLSAGTHIIYFKVMDSHDTWSTEVTSTLTISLAPAPNLAQLIQGLTIDRVEVTVTGQSYFILTLEHRVDPATLQVVADSEQTKLYVDVNGDPVSDGEVAQKIGIIETAREMGDLQLSQRIAALEAMREAASQRTGREWLNLVTSGVVNSIKAVQWQKAYDLYDYLRYWDATRGWWRNTQEATLRTQPTGILAAAATFLIKKLFGDPFAEIKKDLQNWLSSAINYYNSIEGMTNSEIVSYDEAYKFLSNFYYGKSKDDIASYLCDKLRHNIVNLFDSAAPVGKIYALVGDAPLIGSTLALLEFPKLAEQARLATDWTVDTLYQDVVNRYQNEADLLYKLTDAAEYSLELAQAHEEVTSYKVKYLNEQATGRAEAQKIPQAVSDYLWDIDTWWHSVVTVMTLGRLRSPGEFRVYDSQGRVTGLVNREAREEIPEAVYSDGAVLIFNATDSYRYEVVGTDHGTYGLEITSKEGEEAEGLAFANVTIVPHEVHRYTIGSGILSGGQAAATVEIDSDGDGFFEETKTLGPPTAAFTFSPSTISINKEINFDASQSNDADGEIVSYQWTFGDGNTSAGETATHAYSVAAEYVVSLAVVDNDGVVSTYSRFVQVGEGQRMPTWGWAIIAFGILVLAVIVFRKRRTAKMQR